MDVVFIHGEQVSDLHNNVGLAFRVVDFRTHRTIKEVRDLRTGSIIGFVTTHYDLDNIRSDGFVLDSYVKEVKQ